MANSRETKISKFLSLVLRHRPDQIGIQLDEQGYVDVDTLLAALAKHGTEASHEEIASVVAHSDKQRFAFSADGTRIRANQGHSVDVELGYLPSTPPPILYHGTATRFLDSIRRQGLLRGERHHVHLSSDAETAAKVGARHGKPVVVQIDAAGMHAKGYQFYVSDNGVWLTESVPTEFLLFRK